MLTAFLEHVTGEAPPEGPPTTKPRQGLEARPPAGGPTERGG